MNDPRYGVLARDMLAALAALREGLPDTVRFEVQGALLRLSYGDQDCWVGWFKPNVYSLFRLAGEQVQEAQIITPGGLVSAARVYLKL
ncbi:MAG: hypothetical protein U0528_06985 [Anaerolineae bacterium]